MLMFEVQTRSVEEQKLLSVERRTLADRLSETIGDAGGDLRQGAEERGVRLTGPAMVIYHGQVSMTADGPVEICLPVAGDVEPFGGARVRVEPAHDQAFTRLTKAQVAYPKILEAYQAIERWFEENGKQAAGSPREVMFAEWSQIGDDEPAVDVAWPYVG